MSTIRKFSVIVLAVALSTLVACQSASSPTVDPTAPSNTSVPPTEEPEEPPDEPAEPTDEPAEPTDEAAGSGGSGSVTVAIPTDIVSLDPHINLLRVDSSILYVNLYDRLVWYDFEGNILPRLIESWENASDTEWLLTLRKDVTFHNGEPWNADAFLWNWTRELDSGQPRHARMEALAQFEAEVVDEYTVRVSTPTPTPTLIGDMYNFFMLPPQYVEEVGDEGFSEHPVGTGPFKFVEWTRGEQLVLEANPDYWGGAPAIETLILKPIPEPATRISALQVGEVDVVAAVPPDLVDTISSQENLRIVDAPINGIIYIQMFPDSPVGGGEPLNDIRVRQALNYAVDREGIIEFIYRGFGEPRATLVSSEAFGFQPDLESYPYDPDRARELLAEAGYPDGFTIDFDLASLGVASDIQVMLAVIANWADVGIDVNVNQMETSPFVTRKLEFQIAPLFNWNFYAFDADYVVYKQAHSGEEWFYYAGWTPEVDELLEAQKVEMDPERRYAIWTEFETKFKEDAAYVPLFQPRTIYGLSDRVSGFEPEPNDVMFFGNVSVTDN